MVRFLLFIILPSMCRIIEAHEKYTAPSTLSVYKGKRVADSSPAFVDTRKVRDFISAQKKLEHPHGLGWEGN